MASRSSSSDVAADESRRASAIRAEAGASGTAPPGASAGAGTWILAENSILAGLGSARLGSAASKRLTGRSPIAWSARAAVARRVNLASM